MRNQVLLFVLGLSFAVLLGVVGTYDIEEAQAQHALYCEMVSEGSWPSFNESIDCSYQDDEGR